MHARVLMCTGNFRDRTKTEPEKEDLGSQILKRQSDIGGSHSAGFEAWMRSRGKENMKVFTADDAAEQFGVVRSSYEGVPLPKIKAFHVRITILAPLPVIPSSSFFHSEWFVSHSPNERGCAPGAERYILLLVMLFCLSLSRIVYPPPNTHLVQVTCKAFGKPDALSVESDPIPRELEWGQVLVSIRAAPVSPADLYNARVGSWGMRTDPLEPPFVVGNDGVGVVVKVGPGVKTLTENDWVIPFKPGMGTWRSLAVWKESDILKVPVDIMPIEYAAQTREMCVAYRLLEDFGSVKPGDSVIMNSANSTVGQCVIQLCRLLKLRVIAVIRKGVYTEKIVAWLKMLGAADVLIDDHTLKTELEASKFFSKPKLALDCIGDQSAVRLADTLADKGTLVIYGCMTGKAPNWPWHSWVFRELNVTGFNLRKWFQENKVKIPAMIQSLAKLVNNDRLKINYTEYELATEFDEALEHALEDGKCTKVLLKVNDIGSTYD